jgi:hypothetical protein
VRSAVEERAGHACEYCKLPQEHYSLRFHIEHIIAQQHDTDDSLGNLALACPECNRNKGPNLTGFLRIGRQKLIVHLFNPRRHRWQKHFAWSGPVLHGRTRIGLVTIKLLQMNTPLRIDLRARLIAGGHHFAS